MTDMLTTPASPAIDTLTDGPAPRACRNCAHPVEWHAHLRPGTDCSRCGCTKVRGPFVLDSTLAVLAGMTALVSRSSWRVGPADRD